MTQGVSRFSIGATQSQHAAVIAQQQQQAAEAAQQAVAADRAQGRRPQDSVSMHTGGRVKKSCLVNLQEGETVIHGGKYRKVTDGTQELEAGDQVLPAKRFAPRHPLGDKAPRGCAYGTVPVSGKVSKSWLDEHPWLKK